MTAAVISLTFPVETGSRVTFMDVGQGDGIVVETASGQVYLFDCGSSSRRNVGEYVLIPFLKSRGISHIDAVYVSHGDSDHCNGILELMELGAEENITVERLVLPAIAKEEREMEFAELLQIAKRSGQQNEVEIVWMKEGDSITTTGATVVCLHPPKEYEAEDSNAYSQCFYVELQGAKETRASILLTGDVEGEGELLLVQELKNRDIEEVMVLKVAHHGSGKATSEEFLEALSPQLSIISCGKENPYGHPHSETLERLEKWGSQILTTPEYGAITIEVEEEVRVYGTTK